MTFFPRGIPGKAGFSAPANANEKVYIASRSDDTTLNTPTVSGEVDVYGLLPN